MKPIGVSDVKTRTHLTKKKTVTDATPDTEQPRDRHDRRARIQRTTDSRNGSTMALAAPPRPCAATTWRVAVAAATASSVFAVALAGALQYFAGVSTAVLVVAAAVAGLAIGCHLPPTSPARAVRRGPEGEVLTDPWTAA